MIRTFIAVELLPEIKSNLSYLVEKINKPPLRQLRWVPIQNIHLTLKFIGEIQESKVSLVSQKIAEIVKEINAFDIQFGGLGAFPQIEKPRVIWVGCNMPQVGYVVQKEIETGLIPLGIEQEKRAFNPHLTLARVSRFNRKEDYSMISESLKKNSFAKSWQMRVDQIILYRSDLLPGGAQYRAISTSPLKIDK